MRQAFCFASGSVTQAHEGIFISGTFYWFFFLYKKGSNLQDVIVRTPLFRDGFIIYRGVA